MLSGCDYNHWLIVMEFPKDPAPTRKQMIETNLNTLATVLGRSLSPLSLYFMWVLKKKLNFLTWVYLKFFMLFRVWKNFFRSFIFADLGGFKCFLFFMLGI